MTMHHTTIARWALCLALALMAAGAAQAQSSTPRPAFPTTNGAVWAMALDGNILYIGGDFTSVGGQARNQVAAINVTTNAVTSWNPNANSRVRALAVSGSTVYAGGDFDSIGGQTRNRIAALNNTNGNATAWNPNASSTVLALAVSGSTVYAGGEFTSIGGQTRNRIAALNNTTGAATTWNPSANNRVWALAVSGSTVYAGGDFTSVGGQTRNRIAALNNTTGAATTWNPNANNSVWALAVSGSTVYAGGWFTSIGGQPRNRIAALNTSNGLATAWNPNANSRVEALAVSGSTVYAVGSFTTIGGQNRPYLAAFDFAPAAPVTPGATNILQTQITWTWGDASNNETGFKVYADPGAGPPTTLRTTTAANATSWTYSGLTRNTQYAFQVAATNGVGDSARTANITRWTLAGTPLAPVLGSPTGSTINLSINASDGNPANTVYAIEETTSGLYLQANGTRGAGVVFQTRAGWGTTTVTGLSEATLYGFRAIARNGANVLSGIGPAATLSTLDVTPPAVLSITPAVPGPTNADSVDFTVVFSEPVQTFDDATDLVIAGVAASGATISGGPASYTVTVEGITGDGGLTLAVAIGSGVQDLAGNALASSVTSAPVLIDNTPPGISIGAPAPGVSNSGPVEFVVTYSDADAITLAPGDIALDATGTAGATIGVSGSGSTERTVTLSDLSGDGTLAIVVAAGSATDLAGNGTAAAGPSAVVAVDNTPPGIGIGAPSATLTNSGPVEFVVSYFNADNITLAPGDISLDTTGTAGATIGVGGSGSSERTVTLSDITGDGTLAIVVAAGSATDLAGNGAAAAGPSAVVAVDNTPPVFTGLTATPALAVLDEEVAIGFTASEPLLWEPEVTVNTRPATRVAKNLYSYTYTVTGDDPVGPAEISVLGVDLAGNAGVLSDPNALTIGEPPATLPLPAWPAALALLALGGALAARRRR